MSIWTSAIERAEVVGLACDLVRFKTANPPGDEEASVRHLGTYLARAGLAIEYQQVGPGRANLVARLPGRGEGGHFVLSGHIDVVPANEPGWSSDPFIAEERSGRLFGRGTADMKGGLAAMSVGLATLARARFVPATDVILAVTSDEECGTTGADVLVRSGALTGAAAVVIGEPTGLRVCTAQRGTFIFRVSVTGRAAHSSEPERGVNAISYLSRALVALEGYQFAHEPCTMLGTPSINVGTIAGGTAHNIVADRCTAVGMVRLVPGQEQEVVAAEIRRVLDRTIAESGLGVTVQLDVLGGVNAVGTDAAHPFVEAFQRIVADVTGEMRAVRGFPGATEAAFLCGPSGPPMVICGPGHLRDAHNVNESVDVTELTASAEIYALAASRFRG